MRLNFGKRPAEELYSMEEDPDQTVNLAADPKYAEVKKLLSERLTAQLRSLQDPRKPLARFNLMTIHTSVECQSTLGINRSSSIV